MSRHLSQTLAHAEDQLSAARTRRPTEILPLYKRFLKIEEHRLRLRHRAGGGGREVCGLRADLVDILLRHVFAAAVNAAADQKDPEQPLALIAIGGYGRGELNPASDIDVMLLHKSGPKKVSPFVTNIVEEILYSLWDVGFKVGHSTRSIRGAILQANTDMMSKTAMLESRFLAGDQKLAELFRAQFVAKCVSGHEREYVEMRIKDQQSRHSKFGDSVYMQEPNLKSGCGGLRDYQNLLWMTYFKEGALTTTHLVGRDWLTETDRRRIDRAYDFLLRLRTDLHYATGRASDVLHLNLQQQIAERLGYTAHLGRTRSEALMRDYYAHARNIYRVSERITEQFVEGYATERTRSFLSFLPLRREPTETRLEEFVVRHGRLYSERRDIFQRDPNQMMRVFQLAQEHHLELSPEIEDLLHRRLGQVTRTFQYAKVPREMFLGMLSRKGEVARILRIMHRVDFLGRYLPEFGQLVCLVQHEFFHRYTADEHTLVCTDKLDALANTSDPKLTGYRRLFEKLEDAFVLYLALLLHDTGKAVGARPHSEASAVFAQRVASRLQLSPPQRKALILLVDHHMTLSNIAQQRNLDDPATIVELANVVKNQANLNALMLLTLADGQGTGGSAWSDWKELLVWQLYHATTRYLADQESFYNQARIERGKLAEEIASELPADFGDEIETHFDFMPDTYFRGVSKDDAIRDIKLLRTFVEKATEGEDPLEPAVIWQPDPDHGHTIVALHTWDREQLLARIAGSFAVVPINILSVDTFARGDQTVLNVFHVCDARGRAVADQRDFALVERTLREALHDPNYDFRPLLEKAQRQIRPKSRQEIEFPTRIAIDNKAHPNYTLIQIQTEDRIGLLHDLLECFGRCGVAIALSRISTENGAVMDTFYVTDTAQRVKITDSQRITDLQTQLRSAVLGNKSPA